MCLRLARNKEKKYEIFTYEVEILIRLYGYKLYINGQSDMRKEAVFPPFLLAFPFPFASSSRFPSTAQFQQLST